MLVILTLNYLFIVPNVNVKPTFDHLHDNEEYRYDKSQLEWMMPAEVFEKIVYVYIYCL